MRRRLDRDRRALNQFSRSRVMQEPGVYFQNKRLLLDYQSRRLTHGLEKSLSGQRERVARLAAALDAMSPLKVLGRGYAIARGEDGTVLTSERQVQAGDKLSLRLAEGELNCRVEEKNP